MGRRLGVLRDFGLSDHKEPHRTLERQLLGRVEGLLCPTVAAHLAGLLYFHTAFRDPDFGSGPDSGAGSNSVVRILSGEPHAAVWCRRKRSTVRAFVESCRRGAVLSGHRAYRLAAGQKPVRSSIPCIDRADPVVPGGGLCLA